MNLFLKVESRSRLLGSNDTDTTYIAVSQIHKIESLSNESGCVITHGTPAEKTMSDDPIEDLQVVELNLS